jgi:hypothetical protein
MKNHRILNRIIASILCFTILFQQQCAFAQAQVVAPVANFVVNRAIAGTITRVAIARGFAANDARIAATMVGVGSSMSAVNVASTVGGVALAVAGAPVWLTVLGGLGILAVGAAIVAGSTSLKVGSGVVSVVTGAPTTAPPYTPPSTDLLAATDPDYKVVAQFIADGSKLYKTNWCTSDRALPCVKLPEFRYWADGAPVYRISLCTEAGSSVACKSGGSGIVIPYWTMEEFAAHYFDGALWSGPGGGGQYTRTKNSFVGIPVLTFDSAGNGSIQGTARQTWECHEGSPTGPHCAGSPQSSNFNFFSSNEGQKLAFYKPQASSQSFSSLDNAVAGIDATQKAEKISPDVLAQMVDRAWQNAAAQPNYQGLPYSATQPVTPADAAGWQNENPSLNPTLGDLLVPASSAGSSSVFISSDAASSPNPGTGTGTSPNPTPTGVTDVNVVNSPTVRVDWGADPDVPTPSLEQTPTASAILSPLLNLMPSLRSFTVPSHGAACPKPSFSLFEKQIVMDSHCALLDGVKPTLYAVMAFVWLMLAAFIILRA